MSANFNKLINLCKHVNPSCDSRDKDRRCSQTQHGLDLMPDWSDKESPRLILGCGDGYELKHAREVKGWRDVTGVTFLADELKANQSGMVDADIHNLPEDWTGKFAVVYSKETLEHSPCPFLALLETNRVMRMGGNFFHLIPDSWSKQRDWYHFSCLPDWLWCDLFRKAGFVVDGISVYGPVDSDHCELGNKGYQGRKVAKVRLQDEYERTFIDDWRERLQFGHSGTRG